MQTLNTPDKRFLNIAFGLALFTIIFNIAEGLISAYLGYKDESLALFGFGLDSFIEVISGLGITHMVLRIQTRNDDGTRDQFEKTALKITGLAFYILAAGLILTSIYNIWTKHKPVTTFWGIIIAIISILIMWALMLAKTKTGQKLNSSAVLADAECTRVCIYMSAILLISSTIYSLTGLGYIDSIGTIGLAYFAFSEGRECFEKAGSEGYCSCGDD